MTAPITSDVSLGMPQEPLTPEGRELRERLKHDYEEQQAKEQQEKTLLENAEALSKNPAILDILLEDLERTIKFDKPVKASVLCAALSAYGEPINVSLKGESSIGKTHNATNVLDYFPKNDVWLLGGMTPKALIYDHGVLMNKDGEPIATDARPVKPRKSDIGISNSSDEYYGALQKYKDDLKAWKEEMEGSYYEIELANKILCFLEPPSFETFEMLKVILSHDVKETRYKYVNKTGKGINQTVNTVLKGWPSTIFLSVDKKYMAEFATRTFTATPSSALEKISAAIQLTNEISSYPWEYAEETVTKTVFKKLIALIKNLMVKENVKILNPFPNLHEQFQKNIARDMRDFQHFIQMVKTFTMLRIFQRPIIEIKEQKYALITRADVEEAKAVFKEIIETTRTGTESRVLEFYHKYIEPYPEGRTVEVATQEYNKEAKKPLSDYTIRYWLNRLNKIGYCDKSNVSEDNQKVLIYKPLTKKPENVCISEIQTNSKAELITGFEKWLNSIFERQLFGNAYNISTNGEHTEISLEQLKNNVLELPLSFSNSQTEPKEQSKAEKESGDSGKGEIQTFSTPKEEQAS
jgi:hypothetical protein